MTFKFSFSPLRRRPDSSLLPAAALISSPKRLTPAREREDGEFKRQNADMETLQVGHRVTWDAKVAPSWLQDLSS